MKCYELLFNSKLDGIANSIPLRIDTSFSAISHTLVCRKTISAHFLDFNGGFILRLQLVDATLNPVFLSVVLVQRHDRYDY